MHETDDVTCYAFRGADPRVYFLSPWEFTQHWQPVRIKSPHKGYASTQWTEEANKLNPVAGQDFVFTDLALKHKDVVIFKRIAKAPKFEIFRHTWILLRRTRPVVPCPENTPMPGRKCTKEQRATLLSIYLRPWTLVQEQASVHVPFLPDLRLTRAEWELRYTGRVAVDSEVAPRASDETVTQERPCPAETMVVKDTEEAAKTCPQVDAGVAPGSAAGPSGAHETEDEDPVGVAPRAAVETASTDRDPPFSAPRMEGLPDTRPASFRHAGS